MRNREGYTMVTHVCQHPGRVADLGRNAREPRLVLVGQHDPGAFAVGDLRRQGPRCHSAPPFAAAICSHKNEEGVRRNEYTALV